MLLISFRCNDCIEFHYTGASTFIDFHYITSFPTNISHNVMKHL